MRKCQPGDIVHHKPFKNGAYCKNCKIGFGGKGAGFEAMKHISQQKAKTA